MELTNQTPFVAKSTFSTAIDPARRFFVATAKATFDIRDSSQVALDSQDPFPLFSKDVETPLGLLPSDESPRADPVFEVILLGKAYAKGKNAVRQMRVSLAVGSITRETEVFGDRGWVDRQRFSQPVLFSEMPLTYDRAFGGSCAAQIDASTTIELFDRMNRYGRGYDAERDAKDLCVSLRAPRGYPVLAEKIRLLPNLEDPRQPIQRWQDTPPPACWATMPIDIGFRVKWSMDLMKAGKTPAAQETVNHAYHRAHPDWIIPVPPPSARVVMTGLTPSQVLAFNLPCMRPVVDILSGADVLAQPLAPQMLVLLPEQMRFYIVYRTVLLLDYAKDEERSARMRIEESWPSENGEQATSPQRNTGRST